MSLKYVEEYNEYEKRNNNVVLVLSHLLLVETTLVSFTKSEDRNYIKKKTSCKEISEWIHSCRTFQKINVDIDEKGKESHKKKKFFKSSEINTVNHITHMICVCISLYIYMRVY